MNIELTATADPARVAAVQHQNDNFRRALTGGTVLLSAGCVLRRSRTVNTIEAGQ